MALLQQDRAQLARMTHTLSKRVLDKKAAKQLSSLTNKLTHGNAISPADRELLVVAVEGLLASPMPKLPLNLAFKDYALVVPALQKSYRRHKLQRQAKAIRASFREILTRL